jgi:hypothetical protein
MSTTQKSLKLNPVLTVYTNYKLQVHVMHLNVSETADVNYSPDRTTRSASMSMAIATLVKASVTTEDK